MAEDAVADGMQRESNFVLAKCGIPSERLAFGVILVPLMADASDANGMEPVVIALGRNEAPIVVSAAYTGTKRC